METLPSKLVFPTPFAGGENATLSPFDESTNLEKVNFYDGFPSAYSSPKSGNGKFVTRGEMNYLGYMATKNDYYRMCGGINTFDPDFARMIEGYPKGAILDYFDGINLFKVVSKIGNNNHNFNIDGLGNAWAKLGTNDVLNKLTVIDSFDGVTYGGNIIALEKIGLYVAQSSGTLQINDSNYTIGLWYDWNYVSTKKCLAGCGIIANVYDSPSDVEEPSITTSGVDYKKYSQVFTFNGLPEINGTLPQSSDQVAIAQVLTASNLRKVPLAVKAGQVVSLYMQCGLRSKSVISAFYGVDSDMNHVYKNTYQLGGVTNFSYSIEII